MRSNSIFNLKLSIYHVASHVRDQSLWHLDALGSLVVLEDGCHDTGKGESRAIESVAELNLLVLGMTIAALEAICLVSVEVAD